MPSPCLLIDRSGGLCLRRNSPFFGKDLDLMADVKMRVGIILLVR